MQKKNLLALTIPLMTLMIAMSIAATSAAKGGFSGVVDFKQLTTSPPTGIKNPDEPRWIGSILQSSNAYYYEGMSVNQRVLFTGIASTAGDVHTLTLSHQATKGGIHAYDWLTAWDQGNEEIWPYDMWYNYEPCGENIGPPKELDTICENLHTGLNCVDVEVPDDPFISKDSSTQDRIDAYELEFGNRLIRICGNQPITSAAFTDMYHDVANYADTGDTYIHYELNWTSTSDEILIELAGHLAVSGDPNENPIAWGIGLGSSQISGGPYHFKLSELDELSLGSQDNQIKGADILILPGKKGGYKWNDLNGDGVWDEGEPPIPDWTIYLKDDTGTVIATTTTNASGFYLFEGLELGDYTVEEDLPIGWICTWPGPSKKYDFTVTSGFEDLDNNFGNYLAIGITDTTRCRYPVTDFDIVFTPSDGGTDQYKISSTNPGQFYFNILYHSWTSDPQTINYNLADGYFVTVGSMPVHAYLWNDINEDGSIRTTEGCLDWAELTDITYKITTAQEPGLGFDTIIVSDVGPCNNILITIHIEFALKGTGTEYSLAEVMAFEGRTYMFTADVNGSHVEVNLTAHVKISGDL